jgi:TPP-dependent pyruvate/acetoin dehydrogenase alpha subunit
MARGYGVPSLPVEGVDVLQVLQVIETAVDRAREGRGPTLVEVRTARGRSHELRDGAVPSSFVNRRNEPSLGSDDSAEGERSRDPVGNFESLLVNHDLLQPVERGLILDRIEQLITAALKNALEEPFPDAGTLGSGVTTSTAEDTV